MSSSEIDSVTVAVTDPGCEDTQCVDKVSETDNASCEGKGNETHCHEDSHQSEKQSDDQDGKETNN